MVKSDENLELPRIRPLRAREYLQLAELGAFDGERVELLRGVMIHMSPHGDVHDAIVERLELLFHEQLGRDDARIRVQSVLALSDDDVPEPDITIAPPGPALGHPTTALLVVEVAVSTLAYDLQTKAPIYALGGGLPVLPPPVAEYWVVDGKRGVVHVHLEPVLGVWGRVTVVGRGGVLVPHLLPQVSIRIDDIFP